MLNISNLTKSFGGVVATDNVTLDFTEGSLSSIIGPNGAGKTTLFNLITGKLKSDSGTVLLEEEDITNKSARYIVLKGISRAFQISNIFPTLTVKESLMASIMSKNNNFPMWGNNEWTKSMLKKYWLIVFVIIIGCILIIFNHT